MFATNWPLDGLHGDYVGLINAYREIVKDYSADEQRSMFVKTAEGWYRI